MKLQTCVVSSWAVLLSCAISANAATIPLQELVDGASITSGDKLFDEFEYSASGDMPDAADINVVDITDDDGNLGIRFQGSFFDFQGGSSSAATISYTVTVTDPNWLIYDAHLEGNPDVIGGDGSMVISESFAPDAPNTMSIFDQVPGGQQLTDSTVFATPTRVLHVQKTITADAAGAAVATLSFIDQTFSQSYVPEPATLGLLALALGSVLMQRRPR